MRGYRNFVIVFAALLCLYIVMEINRPKPINWAVTLSKDDKIPYGGFIIHDQLKTLFPGSSVKSFRTPLYEQVNNFDDDNTAYIILAEAFAPSNADIREMKNYLKSGNYLFVSANSFQNSFLDTFKLKTNTRFTLAKKDSTSINFANPSLRRTANYTFYHSTIDNYFSKIDTAKTIVLGINNHNDANFIKIPFGNGAIFIHADPVVFSNYFLLHKQNADYAAKAISYIPDGVGSIYWDEYYKDGRAGASTPLRFLLSNEHLRWALRLALFGLILYVLVQVKRKQRVIPVIDPLRNTTIDFIKTVAGVYFNQKDNNGIAEKKIDYFLEFIRQRFNLPTSVLDENFTEQLSKKSGIEKENVSELVGLVNAVPGQNVSDKLLVFLNNKIDNFYKQV